MSMEHCNANLTECGIYWWNWLVSEPLANDPCSLIELSDCGGTFTSPNYPDYYYGANLCQWLIQSVTEPNGVSQLLGSFDSDGLFWSDGGTAHRCRVESVQFNELL